MEVGCNFLIFICMHYQLSTKFSAIILEKKLRCEISTHDTENNLGALAVGQNYGCRILNMVKVS